MRASLTAAVLLTCLPAAAIVARQTAAQKTALDARYEAGVAAFRAGRTSEALESLGAVVAEQPGYRAGEKAPRGSQGVPGTTSCSIAGHTLSSRVGWARALG